MISLILLKLFTFSQILQGVLKLSHATNRLPKQYPYIAVYCDNKCVICVLWQVFSKQYKSQMFHCIIVDVYDCQIL